MPTVDTFDANSSIVNSNHTANPPPDVPEADGPVAPPRHEHELARERPRDRPHGVPVARQAVCEAAAADVTQADPGVSAANCAPLPVSRSGSHFLITNHCTTTSLTV